MFWNLKVKSQFDYQNLSDLFLGKKTILYNMGSLIHFFFSCMFSMEEFYEDFWTMFMWPWPLTSVLCPLPLRVQNGGPLSKWGTPPASVGCCGRTCPSGPQSWGWTRWSWQKGGSHVRTSHDRLFPVQCLVKRKVKLHDNLKESICLIKG